MSTKSPIRWIPTFKPPRLFIILLLPHLLSLWKIFMPWSHNCLECFLWSISNLFVSSHSCNPSLPPIVEHSHILLIIINLLPFFSALWKYFIPSRFHKLLPWVLFWPLPPVNYGFNFFTGFSIASAPNSHSCMSWSHMPLLFLIIETMYMLSLGPIILKKLLPAE